MGWLSAAIGGTFGIVENMMNRDAANSQAKKQFNREQYLMDKQFQNDLDMWHRQNEYNSPINQMKRLEEAGLNPNLMYTNGNVGNSTSMPTMTKGTASKGDTVKSNILSNIATVMQMENLNAQNKLINAQTVEAEERAKGVTLDNIRKGIDNEYLPQRYAKEIDMMGRNHSPLNRAVNGFLDLGNSLVNGIAGGVSQNVKEKGKPVWIPRIVKDNKPVKKFDWSWFGK